MQYDFAAIEKKWQDNWEKTKPYAAVTGDKTRKKFYGRPGPARGASPSLHGHRRGDPQKAHGGLQRPVPHRL